MKLRVLQAPLHIAISASPVAMMVTYSIILASFFLEVDCRISLNYTEIEELGSPCPQLDSCEYYRPPGSGEQLSIKERNCACDELCFEYGDCCIDAPGNVIRDRLADYKCYEFRQSGDNRQFGGVFLKDSCPVTFEGPDDVRYLCEYGKLGDLKDPLGSLPVTDSVTGITYKNYYCSICNGNTNSIIVWTPRLECPTVTLFHSSENITQHLVYQNLATDGNSWGLHLTGDNGSLFFHDCDIDPYVPESLKSKVRLCKPDLISECPSDWEDEVIQKMCLSYMGSRYIHGGEKFRNPHCALCNGMNMTQLSCQFAEWREMVLFRQFDTNAFSLLLDINEHRGEEVGLIKFCETGEVFDPFFKKCRSLTCMPGFLRKENKCVPKEVSNDSTDLFSSGEGPVSVDPEIEINGEERMFNTFLQYPPINKTPQPPNGSISGISFNMSEGNKEMANIQNCLLISLTTEDYVKFPNKSIYVPKYDKIYEPTSYHATEGAALICSQFSESDVKFMPAMGYVTVCGLGISMICLLLHFLAFLMVPDLQNLSGKSLVSQCISLFCAYLCFIIGLFDSLGYTACSTIAFLTFYFFQVSFFWMAAMAYDVWRTLKMATTELRVSSGRQLRRFIFYCVFTWFTPLAIVTVIAFAEYTDAFPQSYRPGFASPRCWFKRRRALLVFFAAPLITIMIINFVMFLSSSRMILMTTKTNVKQQNKTQRRNFKLYLRLALLMGLTWVMGIVAGYVDLEILWYFFVVLNTLQGLFIFVAFTCSTKVLSFLQEKLRKKSSEFKSTTNSASTGSAQTNTTHLHSNLAKKISSKMLLLKQNSSSTNSTSGSVNSKRQISSPI